MNPAALVIRRAGGTGFSQGAFPMTVEVLMSPLCSHRTWFAVVTCALMVGTALAQTSQPTSAPSQSPVRKLVRFVPRADSAPERVGTGIARAGTRKDDPELRFTVLAPATSWLTASESPSLFWHTNKPTTLGITLTLIDVTDGKTLYQTRYTDRAAAGIQRLDLAREGVRLKPNVEYRWVVGVDTSEGRRDASRESIGYIKSLPAGDPVIAEYSAATEPQARLDVCARRGLWYDLLAGLEDQIARYPTDENLRQLRGEQLKDLLAAMDSAKP